MDDLVRALRTPLRSSTSALLLAAILRSGPCCIRVRALVDQGESQKDGSKEDT
jgi:hypothetical protein